MNVTLKDRYSQLKAVEFSARPCFYFYAKFLTIGNNWMGNEDLGCSTDEELKASVAKVKEGYDVYRRLRHLQLEFVESHDELAPGVFRTGYSNGEAVVVNYTSEPFDCNGTTIAAEGWRLVRLARDILPCMAGLGKPDL
jgi:hypothetical protein